MAEMCPYMTYEKMSVVYRPGVRNSVTWKTTSSSTTTSTAPRTAHTPRSTSKIAHR